MRQRIKIPRILKINWTNELSISVVFNNGESRIIVELPGVTDLNQARNIVGTTAQLSFWEPGATGSAKLNASSSAYPLGLVEVLGQNPKKTNLSGNDLQSTSVTFDQNTGKPQVQLVFTSEGSQKFADITKRNVRKSVAIVLDNQVISYPTVNEPILTGDAVISGGFTIEVANALSTELNAGALPISLTSLQSQVIGPSLGLSSLQKSLFAGIIGLTTSQIHQQQLADLDATMAYTDSQMEGRWF